MLRILGIAALVAATFSFSLPATAASTPQQQDLPPCKASDAQVVNFKHLIRHVADYRDKCVSVAGWIKPDELTYGFDGRATVLHESKTSVEKKLRSSNGHLNPQPIILYDGAISQFALQKVGPIKVVAMGRAGLCSDWGISATDLPNGETLISMPGGQCHYRGTENDVWLEVDAMEAAPAK